MPHASRRTRGWCQVPADGPGAGVISGPVTGALVFLGRFVSGRPCRVGARARTATAPGRSGRNRGPMVAPAPAVGPARVRPRPTHSTGSATDERSALWAGTYDGSACRIRGRRVPMSSPNLLPPASRHQPLATRRQKGTGSATIPWMVPARCLSPFAPGATRRPVGRLSSRPSHPGTCHFALLLILFPCLSLSPSPEP